VSDWADHNVHDPGITLLELLEYLGDLLSYYQDQVAQEMYARRRRVFVSLGVAVFLVWGCRRLHRD
jgi:hypothetical protein